jgi:hypothetical protein
LIGAASSATTKLRGAVHGSGGAEPVEPVAGLGPGVDRAGCHGVDADAGGAVLRGSGTGHRRDRGLGGAIRGAFGQADAPGHAADVDDAAGAAGCHAWRDDLSSFECALIGADATTRALIASKGHALRALPDDDRGIATTTIRAFAACDLNISRTARELYVHPNTVRYRLAQIARTTGHDPRTFAGLTELVCVLEV